MAPISNQHQDVGVFLLKILPLYLDYNPLGILRYEPFQMKTGPGLPGRSPDILFVAKPNKKRLRKHFVDGPADLVIEIVSPESRGRDRGEKFFEYEKGHVQEYCIIDPERRHAEFYVLGKDKIYKAAVIDHTGIFHSTVIRGLWSKVAWLWKRPLPSRFAVLKQWKLI
jgi:Uma2 family endonuclease